MAGKFIVIDGPDGSGTTRHSAMLAEKMRRNGETVVLSAEPTNSSIGQEVRRILHGETLPSPEAIQLLFCADRADHVVHTILPALEKGDTVILDRYMLSTIVYGSAQGVSEQWLKDVNARFPKPDLTIITLPPFDICMERIGRRSTTDQFEVESFQRRVYEKYASAEDPHTIFIDTSGKKDDVSEQIFTRVQEHFSEKETRESLAS